MTQQQFNDNQERLAAIRIQIESAGYSLEFNNTDGARCYKNDEFIYVPEFAELLREYETLRFAQDEQTDEFDGVFKAATHTYDIIFHDDANSNNKGFAESIEYCKDYINRYNGTVEAIADYKGGTVQVVCNETEEVVYEESIK